MTTQCSINLVDGNEHKDDDKHEKEHRDDENLLDN